MSNSNDITRNNVTVDDPVNVRKMAEQYGVPRIAQVTGYTVNSLNQIIKGTKACRLVLEAACENFLAAREKDAKEEAIFFFSLKESSKEYIAMKTLADALGVNIAKL